MNFREAENYLLSLGNEVTAMKLGLENVSKLFVELGDPQKNYLKVQVAGTNGKGSVCAFLNSICVSAGVKTGMYTSPHLVSITERVQINWLPILEEEFARLATRVREASQTLVERGHLETVPTFFEQVTSIALLAFADAKVELAILETGLGGRLDATTAANAEIAAITRIDIDHQQYLGETLEEIAAEKAAIIHSGSQVVVGDQHPDAMNVILERCQKVGVEPRLTSDGHAVALPTLGLAGEHQVENAAVAIGIAELLNDTGFKIDALAIETGLKTATHPGRLEWIGRFLLDGAHNAGGAKALVDYLDEFVTRPVTMVFSVMNDKDVSEIGRFLFPHAERLILTRPNNSRAIDPAALIDTVPSDFGRGRIVVTRNVEEAIQQAEDSSDPEDVILVTGSLYLVGEVRAMLLRQSEI